MAKSKSVWIGFSALVILLGLLDLFFTHLCIAAIPGGKELNFVMAHGLFGLWANNALNAVVLICLFYFALVLKFWEGEEGRLNALLYDVVPNFILSVCIVGLLHSAFAVFNNAMVLVFNFSPADQYISLFFENATTENAPFIYIFLAMLSGFVIAIPISAFLQLSRFGKNNFYLINNLGGNIYRVAGVGVVALLSNHWLKITALDSLL